MPPDEDRDESRIQQRMALSGNRDFFFYYDTLIRRVSSRNEKWPRRAATTVVIGFLIFVIYVLVFRTVSVNNTDTERRRGNLAERLLGGKEVGLPNYRGWYPPITSVVDADIDTDVLNHAEGTSNAGLVQTAAEFASAIGFEIGAPIWCDAGTAIQFATRFTAPVNKYKLYAMGIHSADVPDYLDLVTSLVSGQLSSHSCDVFVHSPTPGLQNTSSDAGWSVICNKALRMYILSYESYNDTHLSLRWPSSHVRCLECATDDLIIAKDVIDLTRCQVPITAERSPVSCVVNASDYIAKWTGNPNWKDWHHGSRMRTGMLADAVHESFSVIAKGGLYVCLILSLCFLLLVAVADRFPNLGKLKSEEPKSS